MSLKNWAVLAENYPLMPLPEHLDQTKTKSQCISLGIFINKRESLRTQAVTRSGGQGEGGRLNQTARMRERETSRDQMAADVNQQLTWSQFRGPGAKSHC